MGTATVGRLESLISSVVAAHMHHRRLLCLLDLCYEGVRGRDQDAILRLSRNLRTELAAIALLLPFARTDLRTRPPDKLWMVIA